jgi:3-oxoadipate enol-lactonase
MRPRACETMEAGVVACQTPWNLQRRDRYAAADDPFRLPGAMTAIVWPQLPPGRMVVLPGRGTVLLRECPGPPGAEAVVLIHGLGTSADLNWFAAYGPLQRQFRVVAIDMRGHGRGIQARRGFRLEDCADDVAALAEVLGIRRLMAVGYSMGGLVAQLLWRRHRRLVSGLVLCSTARNFKGTLFEKATYLALPGFEALVRATPAFYWIGSDLVWGSQSGHIPDEALRHWVRAEFERAGLLTVISAARAASAFTSHEWIGQIDVPTAVIVTTRDHTVSPTRQYRLARAIPDAMTYEIDGDHIACLEMPDRYARLLSEACGAVHAAAVRTASSFHEVVE